MICLGHFVTLTLVEFRSTFIIYLTMFKNILLDSSRRGEHDGANIYIELQKHKKTRKTFLFWAKYLLLSGLDNDRYLGAVNGNQVA